MVRFKIQALERQGLKGRYRAGRFFPSSEAVIIVVHEQETDPPFEGDPKAAHMPPFHVGQASWKQIEADRALRIIPDGDPLRMESVEVQTMKANFDRAWEGLKLTHAHELEVEGMRRLDAEKHSAALEAEQVGLFEKLTATQAELEAAKARIAELEADRADETPVEVPHAKKAAAHKKGA